MTSKLEIEKTIANFGDRKSNGKWREFVEKNKAADIAEEKRQLRIANHTMQQWGLNKKNDGVKYVGSRQHLYDEKPNSHLKKLIKHGVENSSVPVSKSPQGSKQHKMDVVTYIDKMNEIYGNGKESSVPKVADQKIFANNINKKPTYPAKASPRQMGDLVEKLEKQRQMTGEMSTWDIMKATAKTPAEKKEIRDVIRADYNKNGAKNMAESDLKWIGKAKSQQPIMNFKIDASGISDSINNYINATRVNAPVAPPKKQPDPDLNLGVASLLGVFNDS